MRDLKIEPTTVDGQPDNRRLRVVLANVTLLEFDPRHVSHSAALQAARARLTGPQAESYARRMQEREALAVRLATATAYDFATCMQVLVAVGNDVHLAEQALMEARRGNTAPFEALRKLVKEPAP